MAATGTICAEDVLAHESYWRQGLLARDYMATYPSVFGGKRGPGCGRCAPDMPTMQSHALFHTIEEPRERN